MTIFRCRPWGSMQLTWWTSTTVPATATTTPSTTLWTRSRPSLCKRLGTWLWRLYDENSARVANQRSKLTPRVDSRHPRLHNSHRYSQGQAVCRCSGIGAGRRRGLGACIHVRGWLVHGGDWATDWLRASGVPQRPADSASAAPWTRIRELTRRMGSVTGSDS